MALKNPIQVEALNCTEIMVTQFALHTPPGPNGDYDNTHGTISAHPWDPIKKRCASQLLLVRVYKFRQFAYRMAAEHGVHLFGDAFNVGFDGASVVACVEWFIHNEVPKDMKDPKTEKSYITVLSNWNDSEKSEFESE